MGLIILKYLIVILIVFTLLFGIIEGFVIVMKVHDIKLALDISNISLFNSLNTNNLSNAEINLNSTEAINKYEELIALNLNLYSDLTPKDNSYAEDTVTIEELIFIDNGFPISCPSGNTFYREGFHCIIVVPIRFVILHGIIPGDGCFNLRIHIDTNIPLNN